MSIDDSSATCRLIGPLALRTDLDRTLHQLSSGCRAFPASVNCNAVVALEVD